MKKKTGPENVWEEFESACTFKAGLNLYENVQANENFYIGKQWEGVQSNGLPTPVFNFIKRVVNGIQMCFSAFIYGRKYAICWLDF